MRVISYGGGVQSTALLVLAAQGVLGPVDAALFANVGDDSEHPATVQYVREVAEPWAILRGVKVLEQQRRTRDGNTITLMQHLDRRVRSVPIPVRGANGAPGKRSCTADYKIAVIRKWLIEHGATKANPAEVLIGFSWDEVERMGGKVGHPVQRMVYPLIDLRLTREDCKRLIERAGLPVPPKSSCFFCPLHRPWVWAEMRRDEPELFQKSVDLERMLNERRSTLGKDPVWLTRFNKPLDEAVEEAQPTLWGGPGETCDEGYCWT